MIQLVQINRVNIILQFSNTNKFSYSTLNAYIWNQHRNSYFYRQIYEQGPQKWLIIYTNIRAILSFSVIYLLTYFCRALEVCGAFNPSLIIFTGTSKPLFQSKPVSCHIVDCPTFKIKYELFVSLAFSKKGLVYENTLKSVSEIIHTE